MAIDGTGTEADDVERLAAVVVQAQQVFRTHFERASDRIGLSPAQASLLRLLDRPRSMHEMAGLLGCDAGNVTGLVDRLQGAGLVARQVDANDRRRRLVALTSDGRRSRALLNDELFRRPPGTGRLSAEDRRTLYGLLERLVDDTTPIA